MSEFDVIKKENIELKARNKDLELQVNNLLQEK